MEGNVLDRESLLALIAGPQRLVEEYRDLEAQLQPNGIDLTVREVRPFTSAGEVGPGLEPATLAESRPLSFDQRGIIHLPRGAFLVVLNEVVNLPLHIMALAWPRSSLLRSGAAIHTAVWDAGYSGRSQVLLTVHNPLGYRVARDARLLQMVFMYLDRPTEAYRGRFQGENL
jgi:dUTP pyrophosphatase